ncbi:MAG: DsbA family protein [Flavobacteriales bacterium]|nr:DsbA family protein [Flavobacteriales bacterium]MBT3964571.1 DsbA family protein [Flavobacteriales bacterium]MBT4704615.1 DsbA family protein [Flavobacteriales bacterium]MBT4930788.1 DsbA family protein [Flavobacteriales bacterium]MBT5132121.1 DsbA family protein [Flavobacteriales bacterium]
MKHLLIVILFIMSFDWLNAQNPTIIYVGDPMCSWCYGFAPEISKVREALPDHEFKLVLGGLRPHGTETNADIGDFLREHWEEIHKRTGQPFKYDILEDKTMVYDTEPACRAVVAARNLNPEIELEFFKAVQDAFYAENRNMLDIETYLRIADEFELDSDQYRQTFDSEECKYETAQEFQLSSEMGIRGFPSVVVRHNGQLFLASNGFRTAEDLLRTIKNIQKEGN